MAYLDGELQPDRAATVQAHLAECVACQQVATELRQVSQDLGSWQPGKAPEPMSAPQVAQTVESRRGWFSRRRAPAWTLVFAAGAAALVIGVWLIRLGQPSFSTAPEVTAPADTSAPVDQLTFRAQGLGGPAGLAYSKGAVQPQASAGVELAPASKIIRTANLTIVANDFEAIRPAIDRILGEVGGFIGEIQVSDAGGTRSLRAMLRVPAPRLDDARRSLAALGRVTDERQSADDVTEQVQDLEARLANARTTEERLREVLKNRTGRVADILEVERELARVREDIERLDTQRLNLERRVTYATINLQISERRQATLDIGPLPVGTRLRNALVDGLRQAYESVVGAMLVALEVAPVLLLWAAVLWWPARALFRTVVVRRRGQGHP